MQRIRQATWKIAHFPCHPLETLRLSVKATQLVTECWNSNRFSTHIRLITVTLCRCSIRVLKVSQVWINSFDWQKERYLVFVGKFVGKKSPFSKMKSLVEFIPKFSIVKCLEIEYSPTFSRSFVMFVTMCTKLITSSVSQLSRFSPS